MIEISSYFFKEVQKCIGSRKNCENSENSVNSKQAILENEDGLALWCRPECHALLNIQHGGATSTLTRKKSLHIEMQLSQI